MILSLYKKDSDESFEFKSLSSFDKIITLLQPMQHSQSEMTGISRLSIKKNPSISDDILYRIPLLPFLASGNCNLRGQTRYQTPSNPQSRQLCCLQNLCQNQVFWYRVFIAPRTERSLTSAHSDSVGAGLSRRTWSHRSRLVRG